MKLLKTIENFGITNVDFMKFCKVGINKDNINLVSRNIFFLHGQRCFMNRYTKKNSIFFGKVFVYFWFVFMLTITVL